eukprot:ANDGO_04398.mRNA.1 Acetylcholinesterase
MSKGPSLSLSLMMFSLVLFGGVLMSGGVDAAESQVEYKVSTPYGPVRGYRAPGSRVVSFLGIPFAQPPVGELRLKPTVGVSTWTEEKGDLVARMPCPQLNLHLGKYITAGVEDCLYLNVWVPLNADGSFPSAGSLSTLFWIYGGGYVLGDGFEFGLYDGANLADAQNIIVVTHNYRLSALGFLALPELLAESGSTGNYGVQDQRMALRFVHNAISAFGGDNGKVTISGESAGGFSVAYHVASPASAGLFQKAIVESGTFDAPQFFVTWENSVQFSRDWAEARGCPREGPQLLSCLRGKTVGQLFEGHVTVLGPGQTADAVNWDTFVNYPEVMLAAYPQLGKLSDYLPALFPVMPFGPTIDGSQDGLPDLPLNLVRSGKFNKVPIIMGTNKEEGSIFLPVMPIIVKGVMFPYNEHSLELLIAHFFNESITEDVLAQYPLEKYGNQVARAQAVFRDYFFLCAARRALRSLAEFVPVYSYQFTYPRKNILWDVLGDFHASELVFVFGNAWPPVIGAFSKDDKAVASAFGTAWANFAKSADPNQPSGLGVRWPLYDSQATTYDITLPLSVETGLGNDVCPFWDTVAA